MKISADCPYLDPRREIPPGESHTIQCCRPEAPYHDDCEPICCKMPDEIEAYRLHWDSAFRGHAIIRVGRFEDGGLVLRYLYRPRRFAEAQRGRFALTLADWTQMNDALIAANFWTLDPWEMRAGLDGVTWTIEGRREDTYHFISRWCPGGALWAIGRLLFDFAGLDELRV